MVGNPCLIIKVWNMTTCYRKMSHQNYQQNSDGVGYQDSMCIVCLLTVCVKQFLTCVNQVVCVWKSSALSNLDLERGYRKDMWLAACLLIGHVLICVNPVQTAWGGVYLACRDPVHDEELVFSRANPAMNKNNMVNLIRKFFLMGE